MSSNKQWGVYLLRSGERKRLGTVNETTEELARCAALSKFGISEDEAEEGTTRAGIYPADDFEVSEE